jgi:uncharacterized DUF497 family protein
LLKHGIDFADAVEIFSDPDQLSYRSRTGIEERFVSVGRLRTHLIAVIFTKRGDRIRIISARTARRSERQRYDR